MDLAAKGEIPLDEAFGSRIDSCVGCLACTTACPSGVQYDKLIEVVRPQRERNVLRPAADRFFRTMVFVRPDVIATANAGCLLQIRRYIDQGVPLVHPVLS